MALGKKIIEWNYADQVKGMSSSTELADAGYSPTTNGVQVQSTPGVTFNPPVPADHSAGLTGQMIASCEDPSGSYARLFVSQGTANAGRFYSLSTAFVLTVRGSTDATNQYIQGKTDMMAFDGEAYITSNATVVRWSSIGSSDTIDPSFFSFTDSTAPHPTLAFNNFGYYGDGNSLLRQSAANVSPVAILTLPASWVIVALGIDPGSGSMLISIIGQPNLSDTINSGCRVGFYDGFSAQVVRYVQVDDMVTSFAPTEGSLYCGYGQNFGIWNGSGITFLRRLNISFDNSQLLYKQHFTSIGSTLYFIERARIVAYGPVRQKGDNVFYPTLTNTVETDDVNLTHITNVGSNQMAFSYATSQFAVFDILNTSASFQDIFSNSYNFDDELWVRRARIVYQSQVANGVDPGSLKLYDQDGVLTDINATGSYDLLNDSGLSRAWKDIDNINLRLKELTFELKLNEFDSASKNGAVASTSNNGSVNTKSLSITVASDLTNALVAVMVMSASSINATGTLNGSAMSTHNYTTGNYWSTLLWARPVAGSNAIVLNWASGSTNIAVTAVTITNAGLPTIFASNSDTGTTASVDITSTLPKGLYLSFLMSTASNAITTPSSQTELSNFNVPTSNIPFASSYKVEPYPGTTSMSATLGGSSAFQINAVVIPPSTTGVNPGIRRVIFYGDPANITGSPNA